MKNILYTFLVFGLFFSCNDNKNDLTEANLNGKVKSIYTTSFEAIEKFGEIEKGDKRWHGDSGQEAYTNTASWRSKYIRIISKN